MTLRSRLVGIAGLRERAHAPVASESFRRRREIVRAAVSISPASIESPLLGFNHQHFSRGSAAGHSNCAPAVFQPREITLLHAAASHVAPSLIGKHPGSEHALQRREADVYFSASSHNGRHQQNEREGADMEIYRTRAGDPKQPLTGFSTKNQRRTTLGRSAVC